MINRIFLPTVFVLIAVMIGCEERQRPSDGTPCMTCENLSELGIPDVTQLKGTLTKGDNPYCLLTGVIGREINFQVALPNEWNERFIMNGNGGFAGSIQYDPYRVNEGYVSAGTDTGHEGHVLKADWALNNMNRQINFGQLSIHRTTTVVKAIIAQYYCTPPVYSYYTGCSRGGGQAMIQAQQFPDDFDGIICAAPAFDWPAIGAEFIQNTKALYPDFGEIGESVISQAHLEILHNEVLRQCDALDGVSDGILNNPAQCDFDFSALPLCRGASGVDCFSPAQIAAIREIYEGIALNDDEIYPGFPLGGENDPDGWFPWITGPYSDIVPLGFPSLQYAFGTEMFKYLIYQDADWEHTDYNFENFKSDTEYAASYLNATDASYTGLKEKGAKMIMWHGWNDPALSAFATINHYEEAKGIDPNIADHIRLFLLPGVMHCGSGPGPSQTDWIDHIRNWVEKGNPPEQIIVTRESEGQVTMERPVFPYPDQAIFDGQGDPNIAASFKRSE